MRGDHLHLLHTHYLYLGSSPHARGPQLQSGPDSRRQGIIPACAGTTLQNLRSLSRHCSFTISWSSASLILSPYRRSTNAVSFSLAKLTCVAPSFCRGSKQSRVVGTHWSSDEFHALAINWLPIRLMNFKRQVLLIPCRVNKYRSSVFHQRDNSPPQSVTYSSR